MRTNGPEALGRSGASAGLLRELRYSAPEVGREADCNYTILGDEVFVVDDDLADDRFKDNPFVTDAPYIRFYAGAPLIFLKNIRLGALCLLDTKPRSFSRGDKAELQLFADRIVKEIAAQELGRPVHP